MKTLFLKSSDIDKNKWDEFVNHSPQGSIFVLSNYLDIITPDWHVIIIFDEKGNILAGLPLTIQTKFTFKYAVQPILAKYWGIMFRDDSDKTVYNEFHYKAKYSKLIIDHLPRNIRYFSFNFSPYFDYPVPFHWAKYSLDARFTYILDISKPYESIKEHYKNSLRTKLSGFDPDNFVLEENINFEDHRKVFETKFNLKDFHITEEYFAKLNSLYDHFKENDMARFYSLKSQSGESAVSILFFYFRDTVYFYLGLLNPSFRDYPIKPYLIDKEIKNQCEKYQFFDFQGSMISGVESFVRSFGARPVSYLNISKKKFPLNLMI